MKQLSVIFIAMIIMSVFCTNLWAQTEGLKIRHYPDRMHYPVQFTKENPNDSVFAEQYGEVIKFNSDSIFYHIATRKPSEIADEIDFYFIEILLHASIEKQKSEFEKMKQAAKRYNSKSLKDIIESRNIEFMPRKTQKDIDLRIDASKKFAEKMAKEGNIQEELNALYGSISLPNFWPQVFRIAPVLEEKLQKVSDRQYSEKGAAYQTLGDVYYRYHDYERAIPYLKMALNYKAKYFKDRQYLIARNTLAVYYANINKLDSSDYYFRSMYDSPEQVKFRPMYDVIAITGIANNQITRGHYEKALPLLKMCLPEAMIERDYRFASGVAIGIAECYLELGQLPQVKMMIDTIQNIRKLALSFESDIEYEYFYALLNKYYAAVSNARLSQNYLDSLLAAIDKRENEFSAVNILNGEQFYYENQKDLAQQEVKIEHFKFIFSIIIIVLIAAACLIYVRLYLKKRAAYRALVQRIQEWAEQNFTAPLLLTAPIMTDDVIDIEYSEVETVPADISVSEYDRELFDKLEQLFQSEKLYIHPDVSLEFVAEKLDINRSQLSHIINSITGKHFNVYVNEYRVKEAVRLMSSSDGDKLSLEGIAYESGFNNRQTFYESFKKATGILPSIFRNNLQKK
ncbi:MAG: helix-turn-helix domain-containing protein [Paludibacter sp.]|nr:helix-turn-helix domain-containing protein [Paludibacter sp.]